MKMKTIRKLDQIRSIAQSGDAYVRWSRGPRYDTKPSRDYVSGWIHAGLSASHISAIWSDDTLGRRIKEYRFLRLKDNRINPYLIIGKQVGRDSDGYESIVITGPIYRIAESLIEQCVARDKRL